MFPCMISRLGTSELDALVWSAEYDRRAQDAYYVAVEAEWMYSTNITTENMNAAVSNTTLSRVSKRLNVKF